MVEVVREGRVDLTKAQVRMLPLNLVGIPVVGHSVQRNLNHLGLSTGDIGDALGVLFDVWVSNSGDGFSFRGYLALSMELPSSRRNRWWDLGLARVFSSNRI